MKKLLANLVLAIVFLFSSKLFTEDKIFFSENQLSSYLNNYNETEKLEIDKDLKIIRNICLPAINKEPNKQKPIYLATAGAPGARKTTILERFLKSSQLGTTCVYLDPDQRALKWMAHTYGQSLTAFVSSQYPQYYLALKAAYDKWREASTYIALTLLEEALKEKRNIAFGTTSTSAYVPNFFLKLKDNGYDIVLLLCSCEDRFREEAISYRNEIQKFYQSSPEDAVNKGKIFPQKMPSYFSFADTLYLFWSDDLNHPERLAGILKEGRLKVTDSEALNRFIEKYETDRASLQSEVSSILSWNELMKLYTERF